VKTVAAASAGLHTGLLRIGALMALATGGFVAFTVTLRPARSDSGRAPVR